MAPPSDTPVSIWASVKVSWGSRIVRAKAGAKPRNAPDSRVRNLVLKSCTNGSSQAVPSTS